MLSGASEPLAVGIFWGGGCVTVRAPSSPATSTSRVQLPPLPKSSTGSRSQVESVAGRPCLREEAAKSPSPSLLEPSRRDNASQTLLGVLQTLHRSIQQDVIKFTSEGRAFDLLSATSSSMGSPGKRYFSAAVEGEDRSYFIKERATEASREIVHAHVSPYGSGNFACEAILLSHRDLDEILADFRPTGLARCTARLATSSGITLTGARRSTGASS